MMREIRPLLALALAVLLLAAPAIAELECTLQGGAPLVVNSSGALEQACSGACSEAEVSEEDRVDLDENLGLAFGLVTAAGMSTSVGAALVFFDRVVSRTNELVLAASLGFAGGVMLYVSFGEILIKSVDEFERCECLWEHDIPRSPAKIAAQLCFFGGVLLYMLLDIVVHRVKPHLLIKRRRKKDNVSKDGSNNDAPTTAATFSATNRPSTMDELELEDAPPTSGQREHQRQSHHQVTQEELVESIPINICVGCDDEDNADADVVDLDDLSDEDRTKKLNQMGVMTALAIALHNFPEGLATFVATLANPTVGVGLAVAIAVHNIPEGMAVAVPLYYATGSRWRGFLLATVSGLAELVGAFLGWVVLMNVFEATAYAVLFGITAGMMVAIVVSELLPTALRYDRAGKVTTLSTFFGMAVMALSLILFLL